MFLILVEWTQRCRGVSNWTGESIYTFVPSWRRGGEQWSHTFRWNWLIYVHRSASIISFFHIFFSFFFLSIFFKGVKTCNVISYMGEAFYKIFQTKQNKKKHTKIRSQPRHLRTFWVVEEIVVHRDSVSRELNRKLNLSTWPKYMTMLLRWAVSKIISTINFQYKFKTK